MSVFLPAELLVSPKGMCLKHHVARDKQREPPHFPAECHQLKTDRQANATNAPPPPKKAICQPQFKSTAHCFV